MILRLFLTVIICVSLSHEVNANDKILDIKEITSPNGITAWLVEDHSLPIIALKFSFKGAGSIRDSQDKQGVAQLLSNTMDEGAGDLTSQEFQKTLSDKSITLNFFSSRDNFGGQIKTLSRHKDEAFNLLKLALTTPRFDAEPLERMRQSNLSRIRSSMGKPNWIAARIFNDKAYENHAYAMNSGGTLTSLPQITADDLRAHLETWLTQDRLHIGVMGDITQAELTALLDDVFGDLPKKTIALNITEIALQNRGDVFVYNKDIPQTILSIALPSIKPTNPDYYALQVMNYIFGAGGFGSRLMEEAREKRGLTYGIYSSLNSQNYSDLLTISTSTKNQSILEISNIIDAEMTRMKTTPVSDAELNDSKAYLIGSMPLSLSSTDNIASTLLGLQLNDRSIDYLDDYAAKIKAVTADDIQRVSKQLLNKKDMMTIMVGQPPNISNFEQIETLNNVE